LTSLAAIQRERRSGDLLSVKALETHSVRGRRSGMHSYHRIAHLTFLLCVAPWALGCGAAPPPFPVLPRPDQLDIVGADSIVVLYYHSTDCFTCFGVLGNWMHIANQSHVQVWLALDDRPARNTAAHIHRLRLPFRVGLVNSGDEHGRRPRSAVKEVLFVHGQPADSGVVLLGNANSALASRIESAQEHRQALPTGLSRPVPPGRREVP
jgi:hypothetical protein